MDSGLETAVAALAGAGIGGLMSLLSSIFVNRRELRAQWIGESRSRRQEIYREFIEEAATCYVDALQQSSPSVASLVILYSKMSRMRVLSSTPVIKAADSVIKQIINTYSEQNVELTLEALHSIVANKRLDLLRDFSEACRTEFEALRAQHLGEVFD